MKILYPFPVLFIFFSLLLIEEMMIPVRIEVQKTAAFFQHAHPFCISFSRLFQIPGQISGNDYIKVSIRKIQFLRIHSLKMDAGSKCPRIFLCLLQHSFCIIYCRHIISCFGEQNGKKSRTCSNIQNLQRPFRQMTTDLVKPYPVLPGGQLMLVHLGIAFRSSCPVLFNL